MVKEILDIIEIVIKIFVIVFGLIILYQIGLKILGGSWVTESLIIALLMLNISITIILTTNQARTSARLDYFEYQFKCLSNDFKLHCKYK